MKNNQTIFFKLCLADSLLKLMNDNNYESINVNTICEQAGIGRTTFYRHLDNKKGKDDLLIFKINYEWEQYSFKHNEEVSKDKGFAMLKFIYENKKIFMMLYQNGLITIIMNIFEKIIIGDIPLDNNASYLASYFTYGYFGIICHWMKRNFQDTPEEIQKKVADSFKSSQSK